MVNYSIRLSHFKFNGIMKDQLVKKYQLEVKDLFESDYHKIVTDEDLVERLISEVQKLSSDVPDLENILQEAHKNLQETHEDLYEAECTIDRLRDEIDELKG